MKGLFRGVWVLLREAGRVKVITILGLKGHWKEMILETHESWKHGKETSRQALYFLKKQCYGQFFSLASGGGEWNI